MFRQIGNKKRLRQVTGSKNLGTLTVVELLMGIFPALKAPAPTSAEPSGSWGSPSHCVKLYHLMLNTEAEYQPDMDHVCVGL